MTSKTSKTDTTKPVTELTPLGLRSKWLEVQKELQPKIKKDGFNTFNNYPYVTEMAIIDVLRPILNKYGLICSVSTVEAVINDRIVDAKTFYNEATVKLNLTLIDPETDQAAVVVGYGHAKDKNGDKALYKAVTGGTKYIYLKAFGLATTDEVEHHDPPEEPPVVVASPPATLSDEIKSLQENKEFINTLYKELRLSRASFSQITGQTSIIGIPDLETSTKVIDCLLSYRDAKDRGISHV